jgi:mono/diheme cytochrome c family protein
MANGVALRRSIRRWLPSGLLRRRRRIERTAGTARTGTDANRIDARLMFWAQAMVYVVAAVPVIVVLTIQLRAEEANRARHQSLVERGRYLARIGVCEACHTPPRVPDEPPATEDQVAAERTYRVDPDWTRYFDRDRVMAGGVPFIIRLDRDTNGIVYSRNITPDRETGIGAWTDEEIIDVLRSGRRPDGTSLFLFAPHSFFKNMSYEDAAALTAYLRTLPPVRYEVAERDLPFEPQPAADVTTLRQSPQGRTPERAEYLLEAVVGCAECHSHHNEQGDVEHFVGGDPSDPFIGVFRLGPDLPLRQTERGLAAFPYPGYAVIYGGNLTRYGEGGDLADVSADELVDAIREGVSTQPDDYGRPRPLGHVMLWQFYADMRDEDAYAIADFIRRLQFVRHDVPTGPILFGLDWEAAFAQVYGEPPSPADRVAFGKTADDPTTDDPLTDRPTTE